MDRFFKNKILCFIITLILFIGGPFIINILFKFDFNKSFLKAEWDAGDALIYYGSIIVGIATIYIAYAANKQSKHANEVNEKLLDIEIMNKKTYLKLNLENSFVETLKNGQVSMDLEFENITNNIIVDDEFIESDEVLIETTWPHNTKNEHGSVVSIVESACTNVSNRNSKKFSYKINIENFSSLMMVTFIIKVENIYGLETKQAFTVVIMPHALCGYKTKVLL